MSGRVSLNGSHIFIKYHTSTCTTAEGIKPDVAKVAAVKSIQSLPKKCAMFNDLSRFLHKLSSLSTHCDN